MKHLVVEDLPTKGQEISIDGAQFHYLIRVRRNRVGDVVSCTNGRGEIAQCSVASIEGDRAVLTRVNPGSVVTTSDQPSDEAVSVDHSVASPAPIDPLPTAPVSLWVALLKGKKFDLAVRQATELGAAAIHPVLSRHCVSRPSPGDFRKKRERWRAIAVEASQQSGRVTVPTVGDLVAIADIPEGGDGVSIVFHEKANEPLSETVVERAAQQDREEIGAWRGLIGPEGGFSADEVAALERRGWIAQRIDGPVLRAETAVVVAGALVQYLRSTYTASATDRG
jgi:16S rRNA (uracil1498-N3)-methyltransferase